MRIREGVMSSCWAGECGENSYNMTEEEFEKFEKDARELEEKNAKKPRLTEGDVVSVDGSGDVLEVTEVVEVYGSSAAAAKDGWLCERCDGEGCCHCNDGYAHGEDRFIVIHRDLPYLCLTRYYEVLNEEESHVTKNQAGPTS